MSYILITTKLSTVHNIDIFYLQNNFQVFYSFLTILPVCGILKNAKEMQNWLLSSFTKEPLSYLNLLSNSYGENQFEHGSSFNYNKYI
jgi:hypothetical protein